MNVTIRYDDGSYKEFEGLEAIQFEKLIVDKNLKPYRTAAPLQCPHTRKVEQIDRILWRFSRCQLRQAHGGLHSDGKVEFDDWAGL